jgi:hypothetical protein
VPVAAVTERTYCWIEKVREAAVSTHLKKDIRTIDYSTHAETTVGDAGHMESKLEEGTIAEDTCSVVNIVAARVQGDVMEE